MKHLPLIRLIFITSLIIQSASADEGFRPIFNGKDLSGWDGNPELWTVQDGCITGKTQGSQTLTYNQCIIWRGGIVKNFELHAKVKQSGKNSGIQYRSQELTKVGKWSLKGYQCDIHPELANNGMMYEERGRGIIAQNGQSVIAAPDGKRWLTSSHDLVQANIAECHDYTVIAQGNHLIHKIDGKVTVDLLDCNEKARSLEGVLAFQIHQGPAMIVQIKDVMLKELPEGDVKPFDRLAIPAESKPLEKVKPGRGGKSAEAP